MLYQRTRFSLFSVYATALLFYRKYFGGLYSLQEQSTLERSVAERESELQTLRAHVESEQHAVSVYQRGLLLLECLLLSSHIPYPLGVCLF